MGRMFEAFKRVDPQRPLGAEPTSPPHLAWPKPEPATQPAAEVEDSVPFIEVGGPRTTMEASPDVLAAGAKPVTPPGAGPRLQPVVLQSLADAPTRIMHVEFRPLADDPTSRKPAHRRFVPELIVALYRSYRAGDLASAEEHQSALDVLIEQIVQLPIPWGVRVGLAIRGVPSGPLHLPLSPNREKQVRALERWLENWMQEKQLTQREVWSKL